MVTAVAISPFLIAGGGIAALSDMNMQKILLCTASLNSILTVTGCTVWHFSEKIISSISNFFHGSENRSSTHSI